MKRAFISGITGQDGSYLAEFLLEKNYEVHAIYRRTSFFTTQRIEHLLNDPNFHTYYGDLVDSSNLHRLIQKIQPDEIYNLGAQSHVGISFEIPEYTSDVNAIGTLRILDAIRDTKIKSKFYQASTSEIFGGLPETSPQNEMTPFYPKSPYGAAKLYAYWITVNYRESFNIFATNGILFNHESPRRGHNFVTKKITKAAAAISKGLQKNLKLGNLDAKRDWGHAKDYVEAMWLMLQQDTPDDYVIATGMTFTVRQFVERAFDYVGIDLLWQGYGLNEKGIDRKTGNIIIEIDEKYFRPSEVELLCGDASKARDLLGWEPKIDLDQLIKEMINFDLSEL